MIRNSAVKCYHEFYVRPHKDLQILILTTPFLIQKNEVHSSPMLDSRYNSEVKKTDEWKELLKQCDFLSVA